MTKCPFCDGQLYEVCNGKDREGDFVLYSCDSCHKVIKVRHQPLAKVNV